MNLLTDPYGYLSRYGYPYMQRLLVLDRSPESFVPKSFWDSSWMVFNLELFHNSKYSSQPLIVVRSTPPLWSLVLNSFTKKATHHIQVNTVLVIASSNTHPTSSLSMSLNTQLLSFFSVQPATFPAAWLVIPHLSFQLSHKCLWYSHS